MTPLLQITSYVAATKRRDPLIVPHLSGHPHVVYYGSDTSEAPHISKLPNVSPHIASNPRKLLGHYRAWCNHREMAYEFLKTGERVGLFFEDDAVPNTPRWVDLVNENIHRMDTDFDVFNFHGRQMSDNFIKPVARLVPRRHIWIKPVGQTVRCYGALAYFLTRSSAEIMAAQPYTGIAIDNYLPNMGRFGCMVPACFDHDRQQGSLIDNTRPKIK